MAYKVLLAQDVAQSGKDLLKKNGFEIVLAGDENLQTIQSLIEDCDAVFSKTLFLNESVLRAGKKLKVVAKHGVGVDNVVDVGTATRLGLYVVNTPLANMESVAEHTMAAVLALSKNVVRMNIAARNNDFDAPLRILAQEVKGKTIGIIGLGNIGRSVAKKAKMGFEMNVLGFDPYVKADIVPDYVTVETDINEIFRKADFVSLHLGASDETKGLVNKERLELMKSSAYFVNFARGALVVESDLVETLRNKRIRGAALDVFADEPVRSDNPLLQLDNVLVSPHSAALSVEALDNMSYQGAMGIVEVFTGKRPRWCVNYDDVNGRGNTNV